MDSDSDDGFGRKNADALEIDDGNFDSEED